MPHLNYMRRQTGHRRGNSTLEMTLVGIPMIFLLISIFEIARGMWVYHTLSYALKEGTRFAIVHGQNCTNAGNSCQVHVSDIAQVIQDAGVGLDPGLLQVQMQSLTDDTTLQTLTTLKSRTTIAFPTGAGGSIQAPLTFTATYPFQSAIAMFWPGGGKGMQFGTFTLPASSQERIQF
jgi:Flp pilus assembly protein TadG